MLQELERTGKKLKVYKTKNGAYFIRRPNGKRYLNMKQIKESHKRSTIKKPTERKVIKGGDNLPSGWKTYIDPESGKTYYHQANTGTTTWEKPVLNRNNVRTASIESGLNNSTRLPATISRLIKNDLVKELKQRGLINDSSLSNIKKKCISYINNNNASIFKDIKTQDQLIDFFMKMAHQSMVNTKNNNTLTTTRLKASFRKQDKQPVKVL
jgi:hypothetical protein